MCISINDVEVELGSITELVCTLTMRRAKNYDMSLTLKRLTFEMERVTNKCFFLLLAKVKCHRFCKRIEKIKIAALDETDTFFCLPG